MSIYTIGFTKKNAKTFFKFLKDAKISKLIDVRLNNVSQLAGFAKRDDLEFFLKELCNAEYIHVPDLAPTNDILNSYKKGTMSWMEYEREFLKLLKERKIEKKYDKSFFENGCLLCSEHEPHNCHRKLVTDYLQKHGMKIEVKHLY
jgi:uncharacterized protein (DUF488 family)